MDFGGDIGLWQRKIAEGLEGTSRRLAVFEALAINSGQAVLDLGCGGGHLVRDFALAVGDNGRAVGLDSSTAQLESANALCSGLSAVELIEGDATNMPFDISAKESPSRHRFASVCSNLRRGVSSRRSSASNMAAPFFHVRRRCRPALVCSTNQFISAANLAAESGAWAAPGTWIQYSPGPVLAPVSKRIRRAPLGHAPTLTIRPTWRPLGRIGPPLSDDDGCPH